MKNIIPLILFFMCVIFLLFTGCESRRSEETTNDIPETTENAEADIVTEQENETERVTDIKINVKVENHTFQANLESNSAVDAFVDMMRESPITIRMSDYGGFEKVGSLGESLPTSDRQTTTAKGDIVLYSGNQIVIFYGTNSWSYTRLGHVDDLDGWEEALGNEDVTVTFSLSE